MELKKGYKKTDIGIIPEEWVFKKIGEIAHSTAGGTPSTLISEYWGGDIKWMSSGDLHQKRVYDVEGRITDEGLENSSTKIIPENCVLIGLAGQGKTRGTVAINKVELCTNQSIAAIFPSNTFDSDYLFYNLDSRYTELRNESAGDGGRGGLNLRIINSLSIALPPLPEQRAIAAALSDVDALLTALDSLIAKKRLVKQGTMQVLLTGKKRLSGFSGEWETTKFGDIFDITAGGDFDLSRSSTIQDENFPYPIYSNALTDKGLYGFCSYNNHQAGSITVTARGTLGAANYRDHDFTAIGRVIVLKPNQPLDGRFFSEFINNRINFVVESTGVPQLTAPQISQYEILFPEFPEQEAIAEILSDMDAEISALETRREKTRQLKEGMMQELLTGRIRLVQP